MFVLKITRTQSFWTFLVTVFAAFLVLWGLSGCENDDIVGPGDHGVEAIVISPDSASIAVGEQMEFSAVALNAAGDTVDMSGLNVEWEWWSTDPEVFTVEAGGTATGHSPGEEFCVVQATILVGSSNFTGRDSAFVMIF